MIESYRTIAAEARGEIPKVKGSRFLGWAVPAADAATALAAVEEARAAHFDARHHCFAFRLGPSGAHTRSSDAGEPSGSAGRPILQQIEARSLTNLVVVVTRYFGGVKLGVGGLARAYAAAAHDVLARAAILEVRLTARLVLEHPYELSGQVAGVLASFALTPRGAEYGALVRVELDVPVGLVELLIDRMRERTGGKVVPVVEPPAAH